MSDLLDFWPTREAIKSVIASQAEGARTDAFLAVHQPMRFSRRPYNSETSESMSEEDLLTFLLEDQADGVVIAPVLGSSGVGKSHAIRWLYEGLDQESDDSPYTVIWVQRTQSAKSVLQEILRRPEFAGPDWAELRSDVHQAHDGLDLARAAMELRTEMVLRLQEPAPSEASENERQFIEQFGQALSDFVDDPNVWSIPPRSAIEEADSSATAMSPWLRLCQHLVQGEIDPDDVGARRFLESDLDFPPSLGDEIGGRALEFWAYLQVAVPVAGEATLKEAALDVLNRLLDGAQAAVLGMGRTPISELFMELRRRLHVAGSELVLLIEDLTVMSGLQRSLLDVMVQSASTLAGEPLCPIRTALALTPGYMQGGALPDNVMTRAKYEWWVEEDFGEKEIIKRYEGLAAGYLNAARWAAAGRSPRREAFVESHADLGEDVSEQLSAFGSDPVTDRHLFPLNRASISVLARKRVLHNDRLVFNPRRFINSVLEPVVKMRHQFEAGRFPESSELFETTTDGTIATRLADAAPAGEQSRLLTVVGTWGGQPSVWEDVEQMPAALFAAFGLTPPEGATHELTSSRPTTEEPEGGQEEVPEGPVGDPLEEQRRELERWRGSSTHRMSQTVALQVRKAVARLLNDLLPVGWAGLPSYSVDQLRRYIHIHRAQGNNQLTPASAMVSLPARQPGTDQTEWVRYQNELLAVLRWDKAGGTLDYYEADGSLPYLMALVDRIGPEAAEFLKGRCQDLGSQDDPAIMEGAMQLQLLASHVSGGSTGGRLVDRLQDLFHLLNLSEAGTWPPALRALLDELGALTNDDGPVRHYILHRYAAFQRGGRKPQALDVTGILAALQGAEPSVPLQGVLNKIDAGLADRLVPRIREVSNWFERDFQQTRKTLLDWFGEESPTEIRDEVKALADQSLEAGRTVGEARAISEIAEVVDGRTSRRTLSQLSELEEFEPSSLADLRTIDWAHVTALTEFTSAVDDLLDALEGQMEHLEVARGDDLHAAIIRTFELKLSRVRTVLEGEEDDE